MVGEGEGIAPGGIVPGIWLGGIVPGFQPAFGDPIAKPITFEELRDRCENPVHYPDTAIQPSNIHIQCTKQETVWVPEEPGKLVLPQAVVEVTSQATTPKFAVPAI